MRTFVVIAVISVMVLVTACAGNGYGRQDGKKSPFPKRELRVKDKTKVRVQGTGTSVSLQMATQIARMNAMAEVGKKISGSDENITVTDNVVNNVVEVDKRVFSNKTQGTFTVWILLEAEVE